MTYNVASRRDHVLVLVVFPKHGYIVWKVTPVSDKMLPHSFQVYVGVQLAYVFVLVPLVLDGYEQRLIASAIMDLSVLNGHRCGLDEQSCSWARFVSKQRMMASNDEAVCNVIRSIEAAL